MMDIKGALTRPLGPLPAWAWGVVIGGGYLLYRYLKNGSLFGSGTTATTTAATVPASDYGSGGTTGTGGTSTSTGNPGSTNDPVAQVAQVVANNPASAAVSNVVSGITGAYGNTVAMATNPTIVQPASVSSGGGQAITDWWNAQAPALLKGESPTVFGTVTNDAGPTANLTGPEFVATVINPNTPVNFLEQTQQWDAANVGSASYAEQLYNRLNLLSSAYNNTPGPNQASIGQAITATQAEINRVEQISNGTGVGAPDRNIPSTTLIQNEGVYTTGNPAIQSLLTASIDHTATIPSTTLNIPAQTPLTLAQWEKNVASRSPSATTSAVNATALKDYNAQQAALKK